MRRACCTLMEEQLNHDCPLHPDPVDCPDVVVVRRAGGRWGLPIRDGGGGYVDIVFCPWCAKRL